jgi:tetratricopeptide (TPR) repeat protein
MRFSQSIFVTSSLSILVACGSAGPGATSAPPRAPLAAPPSVVVAPTAPVSAAVDAPIAPAPAIDVTAMKPGHCDAVDLAGAVDRAFLEKPTKLTPGVGTSTFAVTTSSAEARAFFHQGLALLHSYDWIDAARSFHQALRLDPKMAMAWWGLSRAEGGLSQRAHAREAMAKARELAPAASPREQRYVALRQLQLDAVYGPQGDVAKQKHAEYKAAIEKALAADPSDAEMWVLRGNAEEPGAWGRGQNGGMGAVAFYESALARDPHHIGAHHYLVHALENVGRQVEAEAHARAYAAAVPNVAHAQHMLGHVLPALGKWEEALAQFQKADRLEEAYAKRESLRPGDDWHHAHNLELLGYTYLRLGRMNDAEAAFRRSYETPIYIPLGEGLRSTLIEHMLWRGRYDDALAMAKRMASEGTGSGPIVGHALAAEALVQLGRRADAIAELAESAKVLDEKSRGTSLDASQYKDLFGDTVKETSALVDLGDDAKHAEATKTLVAMSDDIAEDTTFDGQGVGLVTIERWMAVAKRENRPEATSALLARVKKIDPKYVPAGP